jgi:hypothetical protein
MHYQSISFRNPRTAPVPGYPAPGVPSAHSGAASTEVATEVSLTAKLVIMSIGCCVLEGAGRKWLVPGSGQIVQGFFYFSKDFFFFLAAMTALAERPRSPQIAQLIGVLGLSSLLIIVAALPSISDAALVGGVLSIRSMIVIPFLTLFVAPGLRGNRDLEAIAKTLGYFAIPVAFLGALQFYLPGTHVLNRQLDEFSRPIVFAGRVRATGTFSYISGMGALALGACWAGAYFLLAPPRRKIGYVFILAGMACAAASISRGGLFSCIGLVGTLVLSKRGLAPVLLLGGVLVGVAMMMGGSEDSEDPQRDSPDLVTGVFARHEQAGDSVGHRGEFMLMNLWAAMGDAPAGQGLGRSQQAENAVRAGRRYTPGYETEMARICVEIGILGMTGIVFYRVALMLVLASSLFSSGNAQSSLHYWRRTSLVALFFFLVTNTVFNHVGSAVCWTIAAVALATFEIELRQRDVAPARGTMPGHWRMAYRHG